MTKQKRRSYTREFKEEVLVSSFVMDRVILFLSISNLIR
jgi:hypothetical protein